MFNYPKVLNYGHRFTKGVLSENNHAEEKLDGSLIRFGVFNNELKVSSKSANIDIDSPPNLFAKGVEHIISIQDKLTPEYTYVGECFKARRHNTLTYDRVPNNHIMLFEVLDPYGNPFPYNIKSGMAFDLGLECAAYLGKGIKTLEEAKKLLDNTSTLGGTKIEGIVIKNYSIVTPDGKFGLTKIVSDEFREKHIKSWKANNPTGKDIVGQLIEELKTEARWMKAIQHLKERGELEESPRDIGNLLKEINLDIIEEEKEYILEKFWNTYKKDILRGCTVGFAEWYKNKLLESM